MFESRRIKDTNENIVYAVEFNISFKDRYTKLTMVTIDINGRINNMREKSLTVFLFVSLRESFENR